MKKLLVILPIILVTACGTTTGPAEDPFDEEDKEPKISIGGILGGSSRKARAKAKAENDALRERIERLENARQAGGDANTNNASTNTNNTSNSSTANPNPVPSPSPAPVLRPPGSSPNPSSVSFREWSSARDKNSPEYDEFQEYQKWLEFKKFKEQSQK